MQTAYSVRVVRGADVVARMGQVLAVVHRDADREWLAGLVDRMRSTTAGADPEAGFAFIRQLVAELVTTPEHAPAVGAVCPTPEGALAVMLHGPIACDVELADGDPVTMSGGDAATLVFRVVDGDVTRAMIRLEEADGADVDPFSDLVGGVVSGSGAALLPVGEGVEVAAAPPAEMTSQEPAAEPTETLAPVTLPVAPMPAPPLEAAAQPADPMVPPAAVAEPEPAAAPPMSPPQPAPEPVAAQPIEPQPVPQPVAAPPPPPAPPASPSQDRLVEGVLCEQGHFNHPKASYCAICTSGIVGGVVQGRRPSLGVVSFTDGGSFELDGDYIVGREPQFDESVLSGRAKPLILDDVDQSVSRVHAELRLMEWDVELIDRDSANGTFLLAPDATEWVRAQPQAAIRIAPGTQVAFGRRVMTFASTLTP